jgi:hypothetical protein
MLMVWMPHHRVFLRRVDERRFDSSGASHCSITVTTKNTYTYALKDLIERVQKQAK